MKLIHGPLGVASLGTLAITLFVAGCGGSSPSFGGMAAGPSLTPVGGDVAGGVQNDYRRHPYCNFFKSTQNFNDNRIEIGRWLWFTSDINVRNDDVDNEILVRDASITFVDHFRQFRINVPNMRLYVYRNYRRARLGYRDSSWIEESPVRGKGEVFVDGVAFKPNHFIPANVKNVTWEARFYARRDVKLSWQWGAAVYSRFSDRPLQLHVKPDHFFDKNADPAGTPLAFTSDLVAGGTGNGGKQYVGALGKPVEVTTCR